MNSRLLAAINYMLDVFLISFVLLFIESETAIPLVLVWVGLNALLTLILFLVFRNKAYQLNIAVFIAITVMAVSLVLGASVFVFIIFGMLSVYRMHARFSAADDGTSSDGFFLILFMLLFSSALFFSLLNPGADETNLLFPLAVAAIVFYVCFRMLYSYLLSKDEGARLPQVLATSFAVIGAATFVAWLVYSLAENARQLAGNVVGGILAIVLKPLGGLLEKMVNFLSGLSTEQEMQETLDKMGGEEELPEKAAEMPQFADTDYSAGIVAAVAIVIFVVLLILWLRKVKPEKAIEKENAAVQIERFAAVSSSKEQKRSSESVSSVVDMDIIRQAFRDFEALTAEKEQGREKHETVREWMARKGWSVPDTFFSLYDFVRYGEGDVSEEQAVPFLNEIKKLNEKISKENV